MQIDHAAKSAETENIEVGVGTDLDMPAPEIEATIEALGLTIVDFDLRMALEAGILRKATRKAGSSLGDPACLATAKVLKKSVVTANRAWTGIKTGLKIQSVR
jgi:ribonuclease VapC